MSKNNGNSGKVRSSSKKRDMEGGYGVPGQGRGRVLDPEWRENISYALTGRSLSREHKKHISESLKGNQNARSSSKGKSGSKKSGSKKSGSKKSSKQKGGYGVPGQGKNYPADFGKRVSEGQKRSYQKRFGKSGSKK